MPERWHSVSSFPVAVTEAMASLWTVEALFLPVSAVLEGRLASQWSIARGKADAQYFLASCEACRGLSCLLEEVVLTLWAEDLSRVM
jgi:hypothetical protein